MLFLFESLPEGEETGDFQEHSRDSSNGEDENGSS